MCRLGVPDVLSNTYIELAEAYTIYKEIESGTLFIFTHSKTGKRFSVFMERANVEKKLAELGEGWQVKELADILEGK